MHMATTLRLDDMLIQEARKAPNPSPRRKQSPAALEKYIRHRREMHMLSAFGQLDDPAYDYKAERPRRRS